MKKQLFGVAALALMMAGCAKNEVSEVYTPSSNVITFTPNTTRADITYLDDLKTGGFKVYATSGATPAAWYTDIDGTNNHVFAGGKWGWDGPNQAAWPTDGSGYPMKFYAWYPDPTTSTNFGAVTSTPFSAGTPTLQFVYNVNASASAQEDLVASTAEVATISAKPIGGNLPIAFNHILSKVNFNVSVEVGYTAYVQSLRVVNVAGTGTYNVVSSSWSGNTGYTADYTYYNLTNGPAKEFTYGAAGNKKFYANGDHDNLMLMPQDPTANNWTPAELIAGLATKTYIEVIYRLENGANDRFVGFGDAGEHPNYGTLGNGEAELFVKVAFPYVSKWEKGKGYTYNISLPGLSGGYLIDGFYYDETGAKTALPVDSPALLDAITNATEIVRLVPAEFFWGSDNSIPTDKKADVDLTISKLSNPGPTFSYGAEIADGCFFHVVGWEKANCNAMNADVCIWSADGKTGMGFQALSYHNPAWGWNPLLTNAKLYQTIPLNPGTYKFDAYISKFVAANISGYVVANAGTTLPDLAQVETASLGWAAINGESKFSAEFTVTTSGPVSLGFVVYLDDGHFRFSKVELTQLF